MLIMRKYKANKRTELYSSSVRDRKDQERLRDCHRLEETERQQINVMWDFELDPGAGVRGVRGEEHLKEKGGM